jgi:hypothetical protein
MSVRPNLLTGLLLTAFVLAAAGCRPQWPSVQLALSREDIQAVLAPRFPVTKETFPLKATLRDPEVILRDGDPRIGLKLRAEVELPLVPKVSGTIAAIGSPRYEPTEKAFYLQSPEVESLELPLLKGAELEMARGAVQMLAAPIIEETPVYRLKDRTLKEEAAGYFLRDVAVRDGRLHLTLSPPNDGTPPPPGVATILGWTAAGGLALAVVVVMWGRRRCR